MPSRCVAILVFMGMSASAVVAPALLASRPRLVPFDEKVERAAAIFVGRCVRNTSTTAANERILTYSTFVIEKTLKGALVAEMTIVLPGGTVGTVRQVVVDAPVVREGTEYVVFVRNTAAGPTVSYWRQGLYEVKTSADGTRKVTPQAPGVVLIDSQRGTVVVEEDVMTLPQFEIRVRDAILRRDPPRTEMIEKRAQTSRGPLQVVFENKLLVTLALLAVGLAIRMLVRR